MGKSFYILACILFTVFFTNYAKGQTKVYNKIIPKQFTVQYAGSIGFISFGINYSLLKEKLDLGLHYGYVPKSLGGKLDILTSKLKYNPARVILGEGHAFYPFNPVFFVSYTLNKDFFVRWPKDQYPENYYWWNSAIRLHIGFNTEYRIHLSDLKRFKFISLFTEVNTNDLYLASYLDNRKYLSILKIIKLGAGVKIGI